MHKCSINLYSTRTIVNLQQSVTCQPNSYLGYGWLFYTGDPNEQDNLFQKLFRYHVQEQLLIDTATAEIKMC